MTWRKAMSCALTAAAETGYRTVVYGYGLCGRWVFGWRYVALPIEPGPDGGPCSTPERVPGWTRPDHQKRPALQGCETCAGRV